MALHEPLQRFDDANEVVQIHTFGGVRHVPLSSASDCIARLNRAAHGALSRVGTTTLAEHKAVSVKERGITVSRTSASLSAL